MVTAINGDIDGVHDRVRVICGDVYFSMSEAVVMYTEVETEGGFQKWFRASIICFFIGITAMYRKRKLHSNK